MPPGARPGRRSALQTIGRQENIDDLYALMGEVSQTRTSADWLARLEAAEIPPDRSMGG